MNEQAIRFRIGVFVLASLFLMAVLVILFGKLPFSLHPSTTYTIHFENAQGVAPGTPVRRSGVKIGTVTSVALDNDTGKVEVVIHIDYGYIIRKSDRPTLSQSILGGDAAIDFLPPAEGEIDLTQLEPGTALDGVIAADASKVLPQGEDTLKVIKKAFDRIEKIDTVELNNTFRSVRNTSDEIRGLVKTAQQSIPEKDMKRFFDKLDKIVQSIPEKDITRIIEKIDKIVQSVPEKSLTRIIENLDKIVQNVPEKDIKKLFDRLDKLVPVMEGAFDKLDKFIPEVQKTLAKVDKLVPEFGKTNDEIQLLTRNWTKVGERLDVLIRTNEDKIVKTIERTEEAVKRINEILNDENQKNIRETLRNVRVTSDRFDGIAKTTDELLRDSRVTLKTFNESLLKADRVLADLAKATKPLADRGESIMKNLDEGSDKLNRTLSDLREILQAVTRNDGTIQKLLSDPSLYNNLNEASISLSRIMPRIERILGDVAIFADKLARHPELIGIGGVVRPGSGIK